MITVKSAAAAVALCAFTAAGASLTAAPANADSGSTYLFTPGGCEWHLWKVWKSVGNGYYDVDYGTYGDTQACVGQSAAMWIDNDGDSWSTSYRFGHVAYGKRILFSLCDSTGCSGWW